MFVKITIKSKSIKSLQKFIFFFNKIFVTKKLNDVFFFKFFKTPRRKKVFTLLKSPHVNKTAQDKFEFSLFSLQITLYSFKIFKFLILLKRINLKLFPDTTIKVKFFFENKLTSSFQTKNFIIKKHLLKKNFKHHNKVKSYLNLLDMYGESTKFLI